MVGNPALWSDIRADLDAALRHAAAAKAADRAGLSVALREDREVAIGKHVHDACSAIEKALERLVQEVDGHLPRGRKWLRDLLDRAARPLEDVRSAILPAGVREGLGRLANFRHAYRHAYDVFRFALAEPNVELAARVVPDAAAVERFAREFGLALPGA